MAFFVYLGHIALKTIMVNFISWQSFLALQWFRTALWRKASYILSKSLIMIHASYFFCHHWSRGKAIIKSWILFLWSCISNFPPREDIQFIWGQNILYMRFIFFSTSLKIYLCFGISLRLPEWKFPSERSSFKWLKKKNTFCLCK